MVRMRCELRTLRNLARNDLAQNPLSLPDHDRRTRPARRDIAFAVTHDVADGIGLKISKAGGLTRGRRHRDICQAAGMTVSVQDNRRLIHRIRRHRAPRRHRPRSPHEVHPQLRRHGDSANGPIRGPAPRRRNDPPTNGSRPWPPRERGGLRLTCRNVDGSRLALIMRTLSPLPW